MANQTYRSLINRQIRPDQQVVVRITDFSGGHNDTVAPALLNSNEAQKAHNINFDQKGTIQPQKGRKKRYAQKFSDQPVSGLGAFYTKAGTGHLLIAAGTDVYTDEPHMEYRWDSVSDWKKQGTRFEGDATADRIVGSLTNSDIPALRNEKQKIEIKGNPTGGTFKLTVLGQTTDNIQYNASAEAVKAALVKLSAIDGENEQQKVTINGSPTGGTFKLIFKKEVTDPQTGEKTYEDHKTDSIPYNASADVVKTALEKLSAVGTNNVTVTGNNGGPWTITFINALGNKDLPQLEAESSLTGGTNPSIKIETITNGSPTDVVVTGPAGGPWEVEFVGKYAGKPVGLMTATWSFTGGSSPKVEITKVHDAVNLRIDRTWDADSEFADGQSTNLVIVEGKVSLSRKGVDFSKEYASDADWFEGTMTDIEVIDGRIRILPIFKGVDINKSSEEDFSDLILNNTTTIVTPGSITLGIIT